MPREWRYLAGNLRIGDSMCTGWSIPPNMNLPATERTPAHGRKGRGAALNALPFLIQLASTLERQQETEAVDPELSDAMKARMGAGKSRSSQD
jgi:hypothetical protein